MTRCPLGRPPKHAPPPCWPAEIWLSHLSRGRQARLWVNRAQRAFCYSPNREAGKTSQAGGRGGRRLAPLTPPLAPPPTLGRLSLQGSPREGGRATPKRLEEDTGSQVLSWECSGPVNLLLGQHPGASSAPRAGREERAHSGAHGPHPPQHGHCPGGPHTQPGSVRAWGTTWLRAPCVEGHTLTFWGKKRGDAQGGRGEGTSFRSKLVSMWAGPPKQVGPHASHANLQGYRRPGGRGRVTGEGHPPGASGNGSLSQALTGNTQA